jgi:Flp pilus assembly protein TadG
MDATKLTRQRMSVKIFQDNRAATAAEFALVLPIMVMLILGMFNVSIVTFTAANLHFATENTARWAAIQATAATGTLPSAMATSAHGTSVYHGDTSTANFQAIKQPCGVQVTGTANFLFTTGLTSNTIPLTAVACYPLG